MSAIELIKKAKAHFGLTSDCREAGFILPDGKMLDFSGKRIGGEPHRRSLDHSEIVWAVGNSPRSDGFESAVRRFMVETGALRFHLLCGMGTSDDPDVVEPLPEGCQMNVEGIHEMSPTPKQLIRLKNCCLAYKPTVFLDVYKKGEYRPESSDELHVGHAREGCAIALKRMAKRWGTAPI